MICGRPKITCEEINEHKFRRESLQSQNKQRSKQCALRKNDEKFPCQMVVDTLGNFLKCKTPFDKKQSKKVTSRKVRIDSFDYNKYEKIKKNGTEPYTMYQSIFHNKDVKNKMKLKEFVDKFKLLRDLRYGIVNINENTIEDIAQFFDIHIQIWISKKNEWIEANKKSKTKVLMFYENYSFGAVINKIKTKPNSNSDDTMENVSKTKRLRNATA